MIEWKGIAIVISALVVLLGVSTLLVKKQLVKAEAARKCVHVGMGLVCLSFPRLFSSPLSVWLLALAAVIIILVVRLSRLRQTVGTSLFSIERLSVGELLFPVAVAWVFSISVGKPGFFYYIPVLLLTFADTMGALAGTWWGRRFYATGSGRKSVEGSTFFLITAIAVSFVALIFLSELPILSAILLAVILGLFLTAIEGASGHGSDNLFIVLGSFFILDYYAFLSPGSLAIRALVITTLLILFLVFRKKMALNGGAILAGAAFCFGFFSIGGLPCLFAALVILAEHLYAVKMTPPEMRPTHSITSIIAVGLPAFLWLAFYRSGLIDQRLAQTITIYTLAVTAGMIHTGNEKCRRTGSRALIGVLILITITATISRFTGADWKNIILAIVLAAATSLVFFRLRTREASLLSDWAKLAVLAMANSLVHFFLAHEIF